MVMEGSNNGGPLRLDMLPEAQRRLWPELEGTPPEFVLYGGTALALRLGHRQSVDFDFFAFGAIDPQRLLSTIPYLRGAVPVQLEPGTLTCRVDRGDPVQVSFFGLTGLRAVAPAEQIEAPRLNLAALIDLAGTKMAVVQQRAEAKDYFDIHALLTKTAIDLPHALASAAVIYGAQFNPLITLKALSYFGESQLAALPAPVKQKLTAAVSAVDLGSLPGLIQSLKQ